ncbi:hypothetical protein ACMDB9_12780, partial [Faecalibacterium wellingii]|uniref:hypothetical protein n=1 Tax=Faecalibacterium wellingii TaxID=2929491 RepID=UPI0039BCC2E5
MALLTALRAAALFKSSYPQLLLKRNCYVKQKRQWTVCLPVDIPTGWEPRRNLAVRALRVAFADFSAAPWQGFEKSERGP